MLSSAYFFVCRVNIPLARPRLTSANVTLAVRVFTARLYSFSRGYADYSSA